ncbi:MAG: zinc-dependent metalloprotease [Bacteroidota bacterium]
MIRHFCISVLILFACLSLTAQRNIVSSHIPLPPEIEAELSEKLRDYKVYSIDVPRLQSILSGVDEVTMPMPMDGIDTINLTIRPTDVLGFDYFCSNLSVFKENYTYKGLVDGGEELRLTIDRNFLYGYFNLGETQIFFEPLRLVVNQFVPEDYFIFYREEDVINDEAQICNASITLGRVEELKDEALEAKRMGCFEVKLAIASDKLMFDRYGSIDDIEDRNVAVMNNVQGNFTGEFDDDIEFRIVQQVIITNNSDPFDTQSTTEAGTILGTFANWASTGGFSVPFDLGQLWTATNITFDGSPFTIGLAYIPGVCNPIGKFHLLEDIQASAGVLRTLTAHEIGHNFTARHEGGVNIMAPSLVETNNWTTMSKADISNRIRSNDCQSGANALDPCGSTPPPGGGSCPSVINVSGTASGTYIAAQTIQTVGQVNVFNTATFRSGNRILLRSGFRARPGSTFRAIIRNIGPNECDNNIIEPTAEIEPRSFNDEVITSTLKIAPNPTNANTQVTFYLPKTSQVQLHLFDANGRLLKTFQNGNFSAGTHQLEVDMRTQPSGMYYVILQHKEDRMVERLVVR